MIIAFLYFCSPLIVDFFTWLIIMLSRLVFVFLFGSIVCNLKASHGPWHEVAHKNGITVFTRENSLSNIKEVKVVSVFKTTLSTLVSLIENTQDQTSWAYNVFYAKKIKQYNNFHWLAYTVADAPWPIADRDNVTDVVLSQRPDSSVIIFSKSVEGVVPENSKYVRVPLIRATWVFKPLAEGRIKASFQILVELGGNIPEWIVNMFIENGPYQTLLHLREEAVKNKGMFKSLPYIKE